MPSFALDFKVVSSITPPLCTSSNYLSNIFYKVLKIFIVFEITVYLSSDIYKVYILKIFIIQSDEYFNYGFIYR